MKENKKAEWKHVVENETNYWINEDIGNIMQTKEKAFIVLCPKVIKLGPFSNVEDAQQAIESNQKKIDELLDGFNLELLNSLQVKKNEG